MSPAKTAEAIETLFDGQTRTGPRYGVLDRVHVPQQEEQFVGDVYPTPLGQWMHLVFAPTGCSQYSRKQGRHAAAMQTVATISVATSFLWMQLSTSFFLPSICFFFCPTVFFDQTKASYWSDHAHFCFCTCQPHVSQPVVGSMHIVRSTSFHSEY